MALRTPSGRGSTPFVAARHVQFEASVVLLPRAIVQECRLADEVSVDRLVEKAPARTFLAYHLVRLCRTAKPFEKECEHAVPKDNES
jgi:hypothetical protein